MKINIKYMKINILIIISILLSLACSKKIVSSKTHVENHIQTSKEDVKKASVGKWDKINPVLDYTILYKDLKPIIELIKIIN